MNEPRFARLAARALADEPIHVPPPSAEARARASEAIAAAIRNKKRPTQGAQRPRTRWMIAAAAAVTLAASIALVPRILAGRTGAPEPRPAVAVAVHGHVHLASGGQERPIAEGAAFATGDRIVADNDATLSLALATGTRLLLQRGGDLSIVELGSAQVFRLGGGAVRADVAKLHPGERFVVRTVDAEIEVRGTSFVVEAVEAVAACGNGSRTRVTVSEGVVAVRVNGVETRVAAGERWPAGCSAITPASATAATIAPAAASAASTAAASLDVAPAPRAGGVGGVAGNVAGNARTAHGTGFTGPLTPATASATPLARPTPSELHAQNLLFADALAAKRRGDSAGALQSVDKFLELYPASPLAESARAERMRLLGGDDAVKAARAYLARYPQGYARVEAEAILAGRP